MQTGRYYVVDQIEQAFYDLMKEKDSRLAERAAAPRAGCLKGNTFHSARVCII